MEPRTTWLEMTITALVLVGSKAVITMYPA
jgi:hypothetical protein